MTRINQPVMAAILTGQVWPGELASLSGYAPTGVAGGPVRCERRFNGQS
jgi:hypothetical protein